MEAGYRESLQVLLHTAGVGSAQWAGRALGEGLSTVGDGLWLECLEHTGPELHHTRPQCLPLVLGTSDWQN